MKKVKYVEFNTPIHILATKLVKSETVSFDKAKEAGAVMSWEDDGLYIDLFGGERTVLVPFSNVKSVEFINE